MNALMQKKKLLPLLGVVLAILGLTCTDNEIDPFEDSTLQFSVYGAIELGSDQNYVRVRNVEQQFLSDTDDWNDFTVTLENLTTGVTTILEDSITQLRGNYTFNYLIDQTLRSRDEFLLTVSDGEAGHELKARTKIPGITIDTPHVDSVFSCRQQQTFTFGNVPADEFIYMEVGFELDGYTSWGSVGTVDTLAHIDGDQMTVSLSIKDLLVEVFGPTQNTVANTPRRQEPFVSCARVDSSTVNVRYYQFSQEWKHVVDNSFLPDEILESGVIENGLGFFGSYYTSGYTFEFFN